MISLIVAVASNGVIGCHNRLIWHISEDLRRFKRITTGHPVVMGRKTFESLGSKPLPGRTSVVVTRNRDYRLEAEGVRVVHSLPEAVEMFPAREEVFVIGGAEIYRQALSLADRLYLARVATAPEGDAFFPEIDPAQWRMVWHEEHPESGDNPIGYTFIDYVRVAAKQQ